MKKTIYIIILVIVTCICMFVGICMHMFRLFSFNTDSKITGSVVSNNEELSEFSSIETDMVATDFKLETGEKFGYSYNGNDKLKPEISVEDGVLTVKQSKKIKLKDFSNVKSELVITIPEGVALGEINIKSSAGDFALKNIEAKTLNLDTNAGDFDVEDCNADSITVNTNAGDMDVRDCTAKNVKITANAGDIKLEDCEFETGEVDTDAGEVKVVDVTFDDMSVHTNMGEMKFDLPLALDEYSIEAKLTLGEVKVNDANYKMAFNNSGDGGSRKLSANGNMGDIKIITK